MTDRESGTGDGATGAPPPSVPGSGVPEAGDGVRKTEPEFGSSEWLIRELGGVPEQPHASIPAAPLTRGRVGRRSRRAAANNAATPEPVAPAAARFTWNLSPDTGEDPAVSGRAAGRSAAEGGEAPSAPMSAPISPESGTSVEPAPDPVATSPQPSVSSSAEPAAALLPDKGNSAAAPLAGEPAEAEPSEGAEPSHVESSRTPESGIEPPIEPSADVPSAVLPPTVAAEPAVPDPLVAVRPPVVTRDSSSRPSPSVSSSSGSGAPSFLDSFRMPKPPEWEDLPPHPGHSAAADDSARADAPAPEPGETPDEPASHGLAALLGYGTTAPEKPVSRSVIGDTTGIVPIIRGSLPPQGPAATIAASAQARREDEPVDVGHIARESVKAATDETASAGAGSPEVEPAVSHAEPEDGLASIDEFAADPDSADTTTETAATTPDPVSLFDGVALSDPAAAIEGPQFTEPVTVPQETLAAPVFAPDPTVVIPAAPVPPRIHPAAPDPDSADSSALSTPRGGPVGGATPPSPPQAPRQTRTFFIVAAVLAVVLVLIGLFALGTRLPSLFGAATPVPGTSAQAAASATPTSADPTVTPKPAAPAAVGVQAWDVLGGGECIHPFTTAWAELFTVVECASPHAVQLAYTGILEADIAAPYPGADALAQQINDLCTATGIVDIIAAAAYTDLQVQGAFPATEEQWGNGQRSYYCFVSRESGELLTSSVAGPGPAS